MSVVFVPERLRGKAEVNQETLQRVPAYPAQKPHLFSHNCRCDATQRAEDYRVTARTQLRHFIELQKGFSLDCHCEREV
ncbi:SS18-like protein 2 isoform X1 [Gallus gallus]|uniref:SS18-like protein 2 isoform X1 n=1 Tax=Gallus gallus TaxID=9031 RepID=UPI000739E3EA|nr:SS18-like protein 2 isoform X1 [Gallus gallus]XP_040537220.1 SS18-like protein 2 isoform X1 [Gallus gallus]|eukprot:XP_015147957.1 SS18-like protein 2 isoform X1 [Gallus gallus]